ncbi:YicC/YloC family endoribonuclease [Candidatus Contubernalis alkaliaceticus]|uniref:YicC/YloC family endoribonuclease n=1 Tax=Candidatus Contubernalis alkaliaceticus TaxID=338645 RepID=UPI001F4C2A4F|nr:YicC/YloC family endoribonuclease [Candidatus Contubernalis alkalaceticus]UNC92792.1 YicC family protein [Candidatus Contubernalis alkalaceticus]
MISSMTGYGRGEGEMEGLSFLVEIRSVNHRYRDIIFRMPREFNPLEEKMKQGISRQVFRGRMEVSVIVKESSEREKKVEVNLPLAQGYYRAMKELKEKLKLGEEITLKLISGFPEVLKVEKEDALRYWSALEKALTEAVLGLISMRRQEGENLSRDLLLRMEKIEELLIEIKEKAPLVVEGYRNRLLERIKDLGPNLETEENRLLMECTLFAERSDINEETVRMSSHLEAFRRTLEEGGPVGRKMDFLVQELNRETNTIGSKANDFQISHRVVEIKSELEKIREQVQNIE